MKRVSSADIAKLAGVSRSTVSRVINNYPNVPAETRERVMQIIEEQHYYPQFSGQLLGGSATQTLGLFWVSPYSIAPDALSSSYFLHSVDAASAQHYMMLSSVLPNLENEKNIQFVRKVFLQGRIDAGIFVGLPHGNPLLQELLDAGMVVGLFDHFRPEENAEHCITVGFEKNSGEKLVDYLVSMGHSRIGIVTGNLSRPSCRHRYESFLAAMAKHGLPVEEKWCLQGGIVQEDGAEAARTLLDRCGNDLPTALIAPNDAGAFGLYEVLKARGLRIPEDISIVGVDGHVNGTQVSPQLTTISFDFRAMFSSLVTRVIAAAEGQQVALEEYIPGTLVVRESVKKLG